MNAILPLIQFYLIITIVFLPIFSLIYFKLNKEAINLTKYFDSLHTKVYENMLNGIGIRLNEIEPTIKLIEKLYGK